MKTFFPLFVLLYFKKKSYCADLFFFFFLNYKVDDYICNRVCVRVKVVLEVRRSFAFLSSRWIIYWIVYFPKALGPMMQTSNGVTQGWFCISSNLLTSFKEC